MMISKEQLLTISSLNLAGVLENMDEEQFEEYKKSLSSFIEDIPAKEKLLQASFSARDCNEFSNCLLAAMDSLNKIKALDLAQCTFVLLSEVRAGKYDTAEAYLTEFLNKISVLSIDLQMAQYKDTGTKIGKVKIITEQETYDKEKEGSEKSGQKIILAVDDLSFLLMTLKTALQNTPYKFVGVTSGDAALKYLNSYQPDLFILDIEMPGMDGYELAKKIKEKGLKAPIIFLTGNAKKEYVIKAMQLGAVDFIVKPIMREQVLEKINKHI